MRRRSIVLSLVLASTAVRTASVQAQEPTWQTITGADGRFSFDMPTPFRQSSSAGAFNSTLRGYMLEWGGGRYGLDMTIIDLDPGDPDHPATDVGALLKNGQSNVQRRWPGAAVLQQGDISLGPAQGRGFTLGIDGGRRLLIGRVYYLNARLYVQVAIVPTEEQNSPAVSRFMGSLRIAG